MVLSSLAAISAGIGGAVSAATSGAGLGAALSALGSGLVSGFTSGGLAGAVGSAAAGAATSAGASSGLASVAGLTAAGATEGAVTGAVTGGLQSGVSGGNIAEGIFKGAATGAGTGAAGGAVGGAVGAAAGKGASLLSKLGNATKGMPTGGAASITTGAEGATQAATQSTAMAPTGATQATSAGVSAGAKSGSLLQKAGNVIQKGAQLERKAGSAVVNGVKSAGQKIMQSKAGDVVTGMQGKPMLRGQSAGAYNTGVVLNKAGGVAAKAGGQFGVQGALSLISMGQAAKQSNAANRISQQSLLFQQQSYQEQKAEKESFKAGMKQSATESYESSQIFGSKLQGSDANSTLLTSYNTSGNGAAGDYSILTYSKNRDKT